MSKKREVLEPETALILIERILNQCLELYGSKLEDTELVQRMEELLKLAKQTCKDAKRTPLEDVLRELTKLPNISVPWSPPMSSPGRSDPQMDPKSRTP